MQVAEESAKAAKLEEEGKKAKGPNAAAQSDEFEKQLEAQEKLNKAVEAAKSGNPASTKGGAEKSRDDPTAPPPTKKGE